MHEYVHVALCQSDSVRNLFQKFEYQQRSAWAYHSGHSTCKCIIYVFSVTVFNIHGYAADHGSLPLH